MRRGRCTRVKADGASGGVLAEIDELFALMYFILPFLPRMPRVAVARGATPPSRAHTSRGRKGLPPMGISRPWFYAKYLIIASLRTHGTYSLKWQARNSRRASSVLAGCSQSNARCASLRYTDPSVQCTSNHGQIHISSSTYRIIYMVVHTCGRHGHLRRGTRRQRRRAVPATGAVEFRGTLR